jgi:SEC-C motif
MFRKYDIKADLENAIKTYPTLKIEKEGLIYLLVGQFNLYYPDGELLEEFNVKIKFYNFPFVLPNVWETGGKIERIADRHVNTADHSLCLVVEPDAILICKRGINAIRFLDEILRPHLAMQAHFFYEGKYPVGEFKHGFEGIIERLKEMVNSNNIDFIAQSIKFALSYRLSRNQFCYCNSGKKYKNCHLQAIEKLNLLGNERLNHYLSLMNTK